MVSDGGTRPRRRASCAVALGLALALLLAGGVGVYRYLDARYWWEPRVDVPALQARAARNQPTGGGEAETVVFLRALGFPDQHIRIKHFAATDLRAGRLSYIKAWIPQRQLFYRRSQVQASCRFGDDGRLAECYIGLSATGLDPDTSPNIVETTPVARP